MKRTITWGFFVGSIAAGVAVGACGDATPAPVTPADSTSVTATPPASTTPTADTTPTATATETAPPPTASAPTPPPPPPLPASFTAAQTAFFAQADRLNDAVNTASGDCKKMGTGLNKVASDAAFTKSLKDYVAEALKLSADQRDAAKASFQEQQKKNDAMGDQVSVCKKDAGVKAATDKIKKTMMASLKPLMDAFSGAMTGGGAPPAGSAKH